MTGNRPAVRPARPFFSSGPCAKRPGWTPEALKGALVGRSHRSKPGKAKLKDGTERTAPLLGARESDIYAWESFGEDWVTDTIKQLKLKAQVHKAPYGQLPQMKAAK